MLWPSKLGQGETQRGKVKRSRQWAAADGRRDAELAKQINGCYYSQQHNLHVSFPGMSSSWQPPPPTTRTVLHLLPPSFHPQNQSTHPYYPHQVHWQSLPAHRRLAPVIVDDTVAMSPVRTYSRLEMIAILSVAFYVYKKLSYKIK